MSRFAGKVAIVTGASNGIGRETALLLAREGARVTITARNWTKLKETEKRILAAGVLEDHVLAVHGVTTKEADQDILINTTIQNFGRLDILVNNAKTVFDDKHLNQELSQDISNYDKLLQINLRSVVTLTQKAKKYLIDAKGEVVNVQSRVGPVNKKRRNRLDSSRGPCQFSQPWTY